MCGFAGIILSNDQGYIGTFCSDGSFTFPLGQDIVFYDSSFFIIKYSYGSDNDIRMLYSFMSYLYGYKLRTVHSSPYTFRVISLINEVKKQLHPDIKVAQLMFIYTYSQASLIGKSHSFFATFVGLYVIKVVSVINECTNDTFVEVKDYITDFNVRDYKPTDSYRRLGCGQFHFGKMRYGGVQLTINIGRNWPHMLVYFESPLEDLYFSMFLSSYDNYLSAEMCFRRNT